MKILQIHNFYQFKGGEDGVVEAERRMLEEAGHDVISAFGQNDDIKNLIFARKQFYKNLDIILENNTIDIAHIHNIYHIIGNGIYKYLAQRGIPIIQTLHNFRFLCPAGLFLDNDNKICEKCISGTFIHCAKKKCYQQSYLKSLAMLLLVRNGRKEVEKYVTKFIVLNSFSRNKFVYGGFDTSKIIVKGNFHSKNDIAPKLSNEFFLYVGRLSPEKGIETLLMAFIGLKIPLKIAGSGNEDYLKKLKLIAYESKNIEFIGFVSGDIKQDFIKKSIAIIVPSHCYENFPVTILEANSFYKPVIASNIGGLPSIVKDKVTGLLFETGNSEKLREAIFTMLNNNHFVELGKNAYQHFCDNYTEKQNYLQLLEIYEAAIAANKNR